MLKIRTASVVGLDKIEKRPDGLYEQSTPGTLYGELLLDGVRHLVFNILKRKLKHNLV